jgi:hypothetical protein
LIAHVRGIYEKLMKSVEKCFSSFLAREEVEKGKPR